MKPARRYFLLFIKTHKSSASEATVTHVTELSRAAFDCSNFSFALKNSGYIITQNSINFLVRIVVKAVINAKC